MAGLRPRTNSIDPARSARCWWEGVVIDGIRVRGYLHGPFVRTFFAVSCESGVKRWVGGGKGAVGLVGDRTVTGQSSTS